MRAVSVPNAHRQSPHWAKRPPAAGPAKVPTPHIAEVSADARVHRRCGSAKLMTA
ncbi:Uncharacterised protein [Mycobacteroides abscessus subsp. abscessus]|nr:Uncharacterised protein [Mycobacteroides abscessus subsp. abscessus]